ncbi:MAG: 6-phosphofructokinase [Thermodesulfobacteriota bacterium]|nr:6-phosphofructokinase [Thermodesulfobacteriota bacterium]
MKIGVLTGGGDVPGLNPCIKALVTRANEEGHEVVGIRKGWYGLLNYNPDKSFEENADNVVTLDKRTVRTVDRTGGTFLHTSRTNPSRVKQAQIPGFLQKKYSTGDKDTADLTKHIVNVIDALGIDVLVPIGGDDTQSFGERMHREGVPAIGIPKTMDNDVYGTDYCIGFSTAISLSTQYIQTLRTTAGSHERIAVIELFGRNSGETSLLVAYLAAVDRAIISEVPFEPERLSELIMEDKWSNPSNYAMLTISEGARIIGKDCIETGEADAYGHRKLGGIGQITGSLLKKSTGQEILYQQIGYLMRSGAPDSVDLMVGFNFANLAIELINKQVFGRMLAVQKGVYTHIPFSMITGGVKRANIDELYDINQYRPSISSLEGKPLFLS